MIKIIKTKVGWREWVALPDLGVKRIRAKIDTGAKTSALHANDIKVYKTKKGSYWVQFSTLQRSLKKGAPVKKILCKTKVKDYRMVTSSNGTREKRWVIKSTLLMGTNQWPIELTLTRRDTMRYNILLGREALAGRCTIDPQRSYLLGKIKKPTDIKTTPKTFKKKIKPKGKKA